MRRHLWMGIGLIAGLAVGLAAAALAKRDHTWLADVVLRLRPIGTLFVNLLTMVVIPLIATALFAGIAKLGDLRVLGRRSEERRVGKEWSARPGPYPSDTR